MEQAPAAGFARRRAAVLVSLAARPGQRLPQGHGRAKVRRAVGVTHIAGPGSGPPHYCGGGSQFAYPRRFLDAYVGWNVVAGVLGGRAALGLCGRVPGRPAASSARASGPASCLGEK